MPRGVLGTIVALVLYSRSRLKTVDEMDPIVASASWFDAIRSPSKIWTEVERRRDLPNKLRIIIACKFCILQF
eukprot:scaffold412475_cov63-Attheya_sp.AAC.1